MYITLWILYWGLRTINLITQEFYTIEIKHMDSQECELRGIYWWIGDNAIHIKFENSTKMLNT